MLEQRRPVPVRTILATIALVLASGLAIWLFIRLARIEAVLVVATFFAVVLNPGVELIQRRLHVRRGLAAFVVFLVGLGLMSAMLYAFIRPVVEQSQRFSDQFPRYVREARAGKGPVGHIVKRYKLDDYLDRNKAKIKKSLSRAGGGAVKVARTLAAAVAALVTTFVLAFLMILYGPDMLKGGLNMLSPPTRLRLRAVARDCSRALTGYVFGNLLISVISGILVYVSLWILGVPFKGVLALFVGFMDLIPLVGATLGAVVVVAVAFLHSTTAGIAMIVVFVVYQQFENHVLQVVIMSKTVQINQLVVLVSALIGVQLFGFIGALLAIPAAGVIQVVARDLYDHRRGAAKEEPTIGVDEIPVSRLPAGEAPAKEPPLAEEAPTAGDEEQESAATTPPAGAVRSWRTGS